MSIVSNATREFNKQISQAIGSMVKVSLENNDVYYIGRLIGVDLSSQSLCLENAKDERNNKYKKIFIRGNSWSTFSLEDEPFPMDKLLVRLRKILPGEAITVANDNKIYLLGGKLVVTENGVEGKGPTRERIQRVFDNFVAELKKK